jgi:hypothetical protein
MHAMAVPAPAPPTGQAPQGPRRLDCHISRLAMPISVAIGETFHTYEAQLP